MDDPVGRHWGYELTRKAGLRSGRVYPALSRMLDAGWLTDDWEIWDDHIGRKPPPRRYYQLTDEGRRQLGALLAEFVPNPSLGWLGT